MISQAVNGANLSMLRAGVFIAVYARLAGREAIPETTNKKQAEVAEAAARMAVFNGTYGRRQAGKASFPDFVKGEYLNWAKANKKSWRFDNWLVPQIAEY